MDTTTMQEMQVPATTERPLYTSWSQLDTYAQCGRKYRLRYMDRVPSEPAGAFIGGRAVHSMVEWGEARDLWREDERVAWVTTEGRRLFEQGVEEAGGPDAIRWSGRKDRDGIPNEGYQWWLHQIGVQAKNWAYTRRLDEINGMQVLPDGVEMEVRVNLPSEKMLVVRIDAAMFATADGEVVLRDWKAGKVGGASVMQLAIYAWGVKHGPGYEVGTGEFAYLRRPAEIHRHDLSYLIDEVPTVFEKYATGLERDLFPIEPNMFCRSCPVRAHCEHGSRLD